MNKTTTTPYELRAALLNRAIDVIENQYDMAYQTATNNVNIISNTMKDSWDLKDSNFKEAKKMVEEASKRYENVIDDALKLAIKMNKFVSDNV